MKIEYYSIKNCICVFLSNIYSFYLNLFLFFNGFVISLHCRWSINVSVLCDNNVRCWNWQTCPPVSGVGIIWQTECNLGWPLILNLLRFCTLAKYPVEVRILLSQLKGLQFSAGLYFLVKSDCHLLRLPYASLTSMTRVCRPGDKPWIGTVSVSDNDLNSQGSHKSSTQTL